MRICFWPCLRRPFCSPLPYPGSLCPERLANRLRFFAGYQNFHASSVSIKSSIPICPGSTSYSIHQRNTSSAVVPNCPDFVPVGQRLAGCAFFRFIFHRSQSPSPTAPDHHRPVLYQSVAPLTWPPADTPGRVRFHNGSFQPFPGTLPASRRSSRLRHRYPLFCPW